MKKREFAHRKHSILEYFLPDGFDIGNFARNKSNARFISRIRVLSRSHAVFLYSVNIHLSNREFNDVVTFLFERKLTIPFESTVDGLFAYAGCKDDTICGFFIAIGEYASVFG